MTIKGLLFTHAYKDQSPRSEKLPKSPHSRSSQIPAPRAQFMKMAWKLLNKAALPAGTMVYFRPSAIRMDHGSNLDLHFTSGTPELLEIPFSLIIPHDQRFPMLRNNPISFRHQLSYSFPHPGSFNHGSSGASAATGISTFF